MLGDEPRAREHLLEVALGQPLALRDHAEAVRAGGLGGARVLEDLLGLHHRVQRRLGLGEARLGAEAAVLRAPAGLRVDERAHVGRVLEALDACLPGALDERLDRRVVLELAELERLVAGDQWCHCAAECSRAGRSTGVGLREPVSARRASRSIDTVGVTSAVTLAGIRDADPGVIAALVERRGPSVFAYCELVAAPGSASIAAADALARFRLSVIAVEHLNKNEAEARLRSATREAATRRGTRAVAGREADAAAGGAARRPRATCCSTCSTRARRPTATRSSSTSPSARAARTRSSASRRPSWPSPGPPRRRCRRASPSRS